MADFSQPYSTGSETGQAPGQGQEKRFLDLMTRMRNNTAGVYAVHMLLSELRPSNRQPHFMRMVTRSLDSLASTLNVEVFNFSNSDVVVLCRNTPIDEVDDAVFRVRALFNEDPLTMSEDGSAEDRFSTWYDLSQPNDFKDFEDVVTAIVAVRDEYRTQQSEALSSGRAATAMVGDPLAPEMLGDITQKLLEARIGDLVHRQPAVKISAGKHQDLAFREHYIAMGDLRERIAPKINLFAGHWLFQYLSETIDARVLEVLSRLDYASMDFPLSVNLNVSTIMARPFQNFHNIVGEHTDKVIVEVQIIDVFADLDAFADTRDWLQEQGYRVLIDGLNPLTLHFFDPTPLKADFIKMSWGPEVRGGIGQEQTRQIRNVVGKMKPGTAVLSRVDSEEGVSWGLSLGILCFQGHFIDKVVEAMVHKGLI
ncbi:hypothetical protein ACFL12_06435 [Pseudomonadota bacterium]